MTKKKKNRKLVSQNFRNKLMNRRYSTLIKFFIKIFKIKVLHLKKKADIDVRNQEFNEIIVLKQRLESLLDKSAKENVFHKNKSARTKSRIHKYLNKELPLLNLYSK